MRCKALKNNGKSVKFSKGGEKSEFDCKSVKEGYKEWGLIKDKWRGKGYAVVWMLILNSLKESVERPGVVDTRGLLAEVGYSIWKNRSMRLGVVESCELHSHHQNGEVRRGKTAKREMEQVNAIGGWLSVIWWLRLATAMLSVSQWLALPHLPPSKRCSSSNIQKQLSNKTDQDKEKTEKKKRNKRGYLVEKIVV